MLRFVVVGNPENRRVQLFKDAAVAAGHCVAVCAWHPVDTVLPRLRHLLQPGSVIRIDSPGENTAVEEAMIGLGAARQGIPAPQYSGEFGRIENTLLWYSGFEAELHQLYESASVVPGVSWMNHPHDIAVMFDKARCQRVLQDQGIPVPQILGVVNGYRQLRELLADSGAGRVFLKPPHSSSASGVIALQVSARRILAETSVELVEGATGNRLYNSLKVRRYTSEESVTRIIDLLGSSLLHVERWVPKAGLAGRIWDLRVVVVGGRARQVVVRTSRTPMTNLHLGNQRGDLAELRRQVPEQQWAKMMATCEQAASCFPRSLYVGVDLAVTPGFARHYVLETNAFGDLLPGVIHEGQNTWEAEIAAVESCRMAD